MRKLKSTLNPFPMFDIDECECEKRCPECEDCFVAKCQCECEAEAGLKELPDEADTEDADDEPEEEEATEEEGVLHAKELGIRLGTEEHMPEY